MFLNKATTHKLSLPSSTHLLASHVLASHLLLTVEANTQCPQLPSEAANHQKMPSASKSMELILGNCSKATGSH